MANPPISTGNPQDELNASAAIAQSEMPGYQNLTPISAPQLGNFTPSVPNASVPPATPQAPASSGDSSQAAAPGDSAPADPNAISSPAPPPEPIPVPFSGGSMARDIQFGPQGQVLNPGNFTPGQLTDFQHQGLISYGNYQAALPAAAAPVNTTMDQQAMAADTANRANLGRYGGLTQEQYDNRNKPKPPPAPPSPAFVPWAEGMGPQRPETPSLPAGPPVVQLSKDEIKDIYKNGHITEKGKATLDASGGNPAALFSNLPEWAKIKSGTSAGAAVESAAELGNAQINELAKQRQEQIDAQAADKARQDELELRRQAAYSKLVADQQRDDDVRKKVQAGFDDEGNKISRQNQALMAMKVNPQDLYQRVGVAGRIGLAISAALGAFGASFNHTQNFAQNIIDNAVKQNVEAQQQNIANTRIALGASAANLADRRDRARQDYMDQQHMHYQSYQTAKDMINQSKLATDDPYAAAAHQGLIDHIATQQAQVVKNVQDVRIAQARAAEASGLAAANRTQALHDKWGPAGSPGWLAFQTGGSISAQDIADINKAARIETLKAQAKQQEAQAKQQAENAGGVVTPARAEADLMAHADELRRNHPGINTSGVIGLKEPIITSTEGRDLKATTIQMIRADSERQGGRPITEEEAERRYNNEIGKGTQEDMDRFYNRLKQNINTGNLKATKGATGGTENNSEP